MEEVSIKLAGGLGNYMFQIACTYAYGLKHNKKPIFTTGDTMVVHNHINHYKDNILSNVDLVPSHSAWSNVAAYQEPAFSYNEIPGNVSANVYLHGYFQSEKYFKEYRREILDLFSYPSSYKDIVVDKYKDLLSQNTCSIHVRRGDYLNSPNHHPTQNMNYYMKAIKQMPKDSIFLIFSDDISWCKSNFPDLPEKFKFIEGNNDHEDLFLMSMCKNNIICNSSFSWWAAWLNNNIDKKVIAPSVWFGIAYANHNTEDLYCENWIKI
jgi:hypothetical protein